MFKLTTISEITPALAAFGKQSKDGIAKEIIARLAAEGKLIGAKGEGGDLLVEAWGAINTPTLLGKLPFEKKGNAVVQKLHVAGYLPLPESDFDPDVLLGIKASVVSVLKGEQKQIAAVKQAVKPKAPKAKAPSKAESDVSAEDAAEGKGWNAVVCESPEVGPITRLEAAGFQVRRAVADIMEKSHPEIYAEYGKIKHGGADGGSFESRKKAYQFLFAKFIEVTYQKHF
jgi:hypothetical protein